MSDFVGRTAADELIIVSHIYDHAARLRSYEIAAGAMGAGGSRPLAGQEIPQTDSSLR